MDNVILAAAYGHVLRQPTFRMFMNSFAYYAKTTTKLVLFTSQLDNALVDWFKRFEDWVTIFQIPDSLSDPGNKQRHWYFTQFLFENSSKYQYGLTVDARDTIFQSDPFDHFVFGREDTRLFVTEEELTIRQEKWNNRDCGVLQGELRPNCRIDSKQPPINGGFVGGRIAELKYLSLARFCIDARKGEASDQSTLIGLTQWAGALIGMYQVRVADAFVYHGHHHAQGSVVFEDDALKCKETGATYALWHQWDRCPWKDDVFRLYED